MALEFLNDTPQAAFRKLERDLLLVNPEVPMRRFKSMTPRMLEGELTKLEAKRTGMLAESSYGSWLQSEDFVELQLTKEAIGFLKEHKEEVRESETLVPGFVYYRHVKQFGNDLKGSRCYFRESANPMWVPWQMDVRLAKAFEVLRFGAEEDFRNIYVERANGRLDALNKVSIEHLTESDSDALNEIAEYCDTRWQGAWPWEVPSPYSLRESIEERNEMNLQTVNEMQTQFNSILTRLNEEEMDKYAAIAAAEEMASTIEKMVQQIARLGGEGIITLKDQLRVTMGDDAAAQIEDTFLEPVRNAADALSMLRATIMKTVESLKGADSAGGMAAGAVAGDALDADPLGDGTDELGSPMDAMGDDPLADEGDELAGDLADASLDGGDGERPMKSM